MNFLALPPSVADIRRWIRMSQPHCVVRRSALQTLTTAVSTAILWDVDETDDWGMHDTGSNQSRIVIPVRGRYIVTCGIQWEFSSAGNRTLHFLDTGTGNRIFAGTGRPALTGAVNIQTQTLATVDSFNAGTYIEAFAEQDTGGDLDIQQSNRLTYMSVTRIG